MDSKPTDGDSEEFEEFDMGAHFDIHRYDKDDDGEKKFKFTQEHFDQNLIAHENLIGKEKTMANNFPLALRLAKWVPGTDNFIYTIRKATKMPWDAAGGSKGVGIKVNYVPTATEEVHIFKPQGSETDYRLRITDGIKPQKGEYWPDVVQYPESLDELKACTEEKLNEFQLKKIEWREYYNNGVLEGLNFHWNNDVSSGNIGESKRHGNQFSCEPDDRISKIKITYCDLYCTAIEFLDCEGNTLDKSIGKAKGKGCIANKVYEEYIGLYPGEKVVGIKILEGRDPGDAGAPMIGKVSFMLCGPHQSQNGDHWSYSGISPNYDESVQEIERMGGKLMTISEANKLIEEKGVLFPGEDQWAAVVKDDFYAEPKEVGENKFECLIKDGDRDWIQLGDKHHTPGKLHSEFGWPGWGDQSGKYNWRNCLLWKVNDTNQVMVRPKKEEEAKVEEAASEGRKIPAQKDFFLATIKVFKQSETGEVQLVREILTDNNLFAAMDYGPSVAFFQKNMYYFKRLMKQGADVTLQMFKYNFEADEESKIEGIFFTEDEEGETKIQFFEQAQSIVDTWATEEEFVKNTFVSRQETMREPWKAELKTEFNVFKLDNLEKPVFDGTALKHPYFSKQVLWVDHENKKIRFQVYNTSHKRVVTIPLQDETYVGAPEDVKETKNSNDYHQDWPFDLREAKVKLNGQMITVHFFLVLANEDKKVSFEVFGPSTLTDAEMGKVTNQLKQKFSSGMCQKGSFSQNITILDRFGHEDENVLFPAMVPRDFARQIFEGHQGIDNHRKLYESPNRKSLILYCLAGREILVATLKADSKFNTVQEVFAASGFDPTPQDKKVDELVKMVKMLQGTVAEMAKKIEVLEQKAAETAS